MTSPPILSCPATGADRVARAAAGLVLAAAAGCCQVPNREFPEQEPVRTETTFLLYGDSFVERWGGALGYATELTERLEARGEVVGNEGNAGRETGIGAITDPVRDRCPALVCHVFYDCLAKGNAPLVNVLAEHPNARRLLITLGGVDAIEGIRLAYGEPWQIPGGPAPAPPVLEDVATAMLRNLDRTLELALADRTWDWIGITSYPYMPADSTDPVVPCPTGAPVGPGQQAYLNAYGRALDAIIGRVAERRGVAFVSLLDALGGGEPVPGGESGPPGELFADCAHPSPEGYGPVVDRILDAIDAAPGPPGASPAARGQA